MKKIKNIVISIVLSALLSITAVVSGLFNTSVSVETRDVDVDSIGTLSYTEKIDKMLSNFSSYSGSTDGDVMCFEAEQELNFDEIMELAFVSSTEDPVTVKYSTRLDMENEKFYILTKYFQNDELIKTEEVESEPVYEEYADDYYLIMPDGTKSSVKNMLAEDNLNECSLVLTATAASYAAVALLALTVVVMAPTIIESVVTIVTAVVSWVRSFFSWFRSLFTKKTTYVTTTTTTVVLTPSISIAGTKVETKSLTKSETKTMLKADAYYLSFADPTNGKMYFSVSPITYEVALTIMMTPILVPCIGNSNKDMIASVFAISQALAYQVAVDAGIASLVPEKHGADYYMHYHSIYETRTRQNTMARPHAFFLDYALGYGA